MKVSCIKYANDQSDCQEMSFEQIHTIHIGYMQLYIHNVSHTYVSSSSLTYLVVLGGDELVDRHGDHLHGLGAHLARHVELLHIMTHKYT